MSEQVLRDRSGRLIGRISERTDGKLELRDSGGGLKVIYDPKQNVTRDASGKLVARGNTLTNLL